MTLQDFYDEPINRDGPIFIDVWVPRVSLGVTGLRRAGLDGPLVRCADIASCPHLEAQGGSDSEKLQRTLLSSLTSHSSLAPSPATSPYPPSTTCERA